MNTNYSPIKASLASIEVAKKYGVSRSTVDYAIRKRFRFPRELKDLLKSYYLLYWSGEYIKEKLSEGQIVHNNVTYNVLYFGCIPKDFKAGIQFALSFREAVEEYQLPAYVIISEGRMYS